MNFMLFLEFVNTNENGFVLNWRDKGRRFLCREIIFRQPRFFPFLCIGAEMILVTGGAGFIGSNFIRKWLSENAEDVFSLDALKNSGADSLIKDLRDIKTYSFVEGDITDAELLNNIFDIDYSKAC